MIYIFRGMGLLALLFVINLCFALSHLRELGYLNEDAALIEEAVKYYSTGQIWRFFFESYGPDIIRPFQVLGMALEAKLFGNNPLPSHLLTILWLASGQALLWYVLRKHLSVAGAALSLLLIGFSMNGSEPIRWLSARHDLYLLFFFGLSLLSGRWLFFSALKRWPATLTGAAGLSISLWGGFYSSEKGAAIPLLVLLYVLILAIMEADRDKQCNLVEKEVGTTTFCQSKILKRFFLLALILALNLIGYFALRYAVLGAFIGGYTGSLIGQEMPLYELIPRWLLTLATSPFRQSSSTLTLLALFISAPLFLSAFWLVGRELTKKEALIGAILIVGILCSGLPTMQFSYLGIIDKPLNSRMLWFPHLLISISLATLIDRGFSLAKSTRTQAILMLLALPFILSVTWSGQSALKSFASAGAYSRRAAALFKKYCVCVDKQEPQTKGLYSIAYQVNTFTEEIWLGYYLSWQGLPSCSVDLPEERCEIEFHTLHDGLEARPIRVSGSILDLAKEVWSNALPASRESLRSRIENFPRERTKIASTPGPILISGWAYQRKTQKPMEQIALFADEKLLQITPPNIHRADILPKRLKERTNGESSAPLLLGFALYIRAEEIPPNSKELRLEALTPAREDGKNHRIILRTRQLEE